MPQVVSLFILLILVIRDNSYTINCVTADFIVLFMAVLQLGKHLATIEFVFLHL